MRPVASHTSSLLTAVALLLATAVLAACAPGAQEGSSAGETGGSMTSAPAGSAPAEGFSAPSAPVFAPPADAVRSYLAWVTYAYERADSQLAVDTMTPAEEVRVDSYVQLNKEKNRRIRQYLVEFAPRDEITQGATVLVPARERWEYRYLDLTTTRAVSPTYTVSYETTYTLVPHEDSGWIVDSVAATPLDEVR